MTGGNNKCLVRISSALRRKSSVFVAWPLNICYLFYNLKPLIKCFY